MSCNFALKQCEPYTLHIYHSYTSEDVDHPSEPDHNDDPRYNLTTCGHFSTNFNSCPPGQCGFWSNSTWMSPSHIHHRTKILFAMLFEMPQYGNTSCSIENALSLNAFLSCGWIRRWRRTNSVLDVFAYLQTPNHEKSIHKTQCMDPTVEICRRWDKLNTNLHSPHNWFKNEYIHQTAI